ncbi:unnamed protein product [Allacma fusca]|uniref:Uncharacterized protein n=1 Tax=Allacma fusca TaxID=39272 RepID=A0A8J2L458_9HEXA|nr:unnamed protein product [Allacma fusca]
MISMHEPITHKARFWSSYVGALKGTQDMRADDSRRHRRPLSEGFDPFIRLFDDSPFIDDANSRIHAPGYRYQPVSRETYGYSPRYIPSAATERPSRFLASRNVRFDAKGSGEKVCPDKVAISRG